jgi:phage terminase large subunit GpA-like protein
MDDKEINKELNAISTLNGWGVLGLLIPLIGVICYGVSHSRANKLLLFMSDEQKEKYKGTVHSRKVFSTFMTIVCLLIVGYWLIVWVDNANQVTNYSQGQTTVIPSAEEMQAAALNACLDSVNTWYETNRANTTTVFQEENLLQDKQQRIDECRIRYP